VVQHLLVALSAFTDTQTVRNAMAYLIQINDEIRETTSKETAALDAHYADGAQQAQIDSDRAKSKADTLAKLGLTADEVAALLS